MKESTWRNPEYEMPSWAFWSQESQCRYTRELNYTTRSRITWLSTTNRIGKSCSFKPLRFGEVYQAGRIGMLIFHILTFHSTSCFRPQLLAHGWKKTCKCPGWCGSGLSAGLRTKGSLVRFPVRVHAWFSGQTPNRGHTRGNHTLMFLSLSPKK